MSNIRKIKNEIKTLTMLDTVSKSILNSALIKMTHYKYLMENQLEILNILHHGAYLMGYFNKKNLILNKKYICFLAEFGFCGGFNNKIYTTLNNLGINKNQIIEITNNLDVNRIKYDNIYDIYGVFMNKHNIEFINIVNLYEKYINDQTQSNIAKKYLMEFDENFENLYFVGFLKYCFYSSKFYENFSRVNIITQAIDNIKTNKHDLNIEFSRSKQNNINNELAIIISSQGGK